MDSTRRQRLKDLEIDLWVPRAAVPAPATQDAAVPEPSAITPSNVEKPKRGRPRKEPAAVVETAISPALPPIEMPQDWDGLREMVRACTRCGLRASCTQTVFGTGVPTAPLMVVGEGPGADEDAQGEPFVGRAGKLLDEMLRSIGRSRRENVFIANVVKCRPPGNRDPEPGEAEACRPYLEQQIRLVKPKLIVALGRIAAQRLLNTDEPLARLRGPLHTYGPEQTPLFITYHPAYLLRSPREKAKSWEDLKKVHRFLSGAAT